MRKIIFLGMIGLSVCFGVTQQQREAFKSGFKTGLAMLEFEFLNEGVGVRESDFPKNGYVVYMPIEKIPIPDVLYFQYMANRDGFKTLLAKTELIFGFFDREADAIDSVKRIYSLYQVNAKITKSSKVFYIYPILMQKTYSEFIKQAQQQGLKIYTDVLVAEAPKTNISSPKPKSKPPKQVKKYFLLKNDLTQSYLLIGNQGHSNNFQEANLIYGFQRYELEKVIKTQEGETFYKVKNENLYFSKDDVLEERK